LGRVRKGRGAFKGTHCRAPCLWAVVFCVFASGLTITLWQFYLPTICCFSSWNLRPGRHQPGARSQALGVGDGDGDGGGIQSVAQTQGPKPSPSPSSSWGPIGRVRVESCQTGRKRADFSGRKH